MKYKYNIYALEHEWLQCSGIGHHSPAYCISLYDISDYYYYYYKV